MIRRSPLDGEHERLGCRFTEFAGWRMPLAYQGTIAEHRAVRERVGLFDVSHLGKLWVEGPEIEGRLDSLLPGRVKALDVWSAGYNFLLNDQGGIVDDLFLYRYPHGFLVVPNAANTDLVMAQMAETPIAVVDQRSEWAILALSGPLARDVLFGELAQYRTLKLHRFRDLELDGARVMIARTGYTGEPTYELFVPHDHAVAIWRRLLEAGAPHGIVPSGLGARDTLRLEMGYPLHGNDISEATSPLEAGLEWVIDWTKEFPARPALERIKSEGKPRLIGLVARGRQVPRKGYAVWRDDTEVGHVTSGGFSPVLSRGIALAYLSAEAAVAGTEVWVDIRGKRLEAEVVKPPFITRPKRG